MVIDMREWPKPEREEAMLQGANDWIEVDGACASLWWESVPHSEDGKVGLIGYFYASSVEAGCGLLRLACDRLREVGCELALGPMNGSTWRPYRLVLGNHGRPSFFMEPKNPEEWVESFKSAGFSVDSDYTSAVVDLGVGGPDLDRIRRDFAGMGLRMRPLHADRYLAELEAIHALSVEAFANNPWFTPQSFDDFRGGYERLQEHIVPEFVLAAECGDRLEGFVFGLPDLNALAAWRKPALIVKTLAVHPRSRFRGLGTILVDEVQKRAREAGYEEAIHALQHVGNPSVRLGGRFNPIVFRHYALFRRRL